MKNFRLRHSYIIFFVTFSFNLTITSMCYAISEVETYKRLEIDWSNLKLRFYGIGNADPSKNETYKEIEKKAWEEGLLNVEKQLSSYFKEKSTPQTRIAEKNVSHATYSYKNEYFKDGGIKVYMESNLVNAFDLDQIAFATEKDPSEQDTKTQDEYTGLLLELEAKTPVTPVGIYQIHDENGNILYNINMLRRTAFMQNLMGHWFNKPSDTELYPFVGNNPIKLKIKKNSQHTNIFIVPASSWQTALKKSPNILANATIAFSIPKSQ